MPPQARVEILVVNLEETTDVRTERANWLSELRTRHLFAKMSKEEILAALRKTREEVWNERHEG